ncbi:NUDIX hydrolase [Ktedonosporobacter rubrisoli]|uniref:NUDIX hydrolase n=1 Tax=Ktedonosporobacter rubrisoli TaxID=2509675 RepID=A0A4P6JYH0_KTERU|nr:NUDIX hydrolase [Ktedonosporobacter rubrisoli]QBD80532.1 NUDIX hydrolase [Ktedonosporobacter rubrisoli]
MIEFEVIARGLYRPQQFIIEYRPELRMPLTPDIQAWMDEQWTQKLARARQDGTLLFDAPLFRFIEAQAGADDTLHLTLGETSYKQYVTTRMPAFAQGRARQELGNALSVCSVVETSDDYILLDKRQGVDVYVGRYHVIGGFFERERDMAAQPDPFGAMRREIREETGVQAEDISEQYCLGVVYDLATPHAELCFLTRLHISLAEVLKREPEEDEIKQLLSLKVSAESLREFIVSQHGNISATGEPNLLFYGAWKFGEAWYAELLTGLR